MAGITPRRFCVAGISNTVSASCLGAFMACLAVGVITYMYMCNILLLRLYVAYTKRTKAYNNYYVLLLLLEKQHYNVYCYLACFCWCHSAVVKNAFFNLLLLLLLLIYEIMSCVYVNFIVNYYSYYKCYIMYDENLTRLVKCSIPRERLPCRFKTHTHSHKTCLL